MRKATKDEESSSSASESDGAKAPHKERQLRQQVETLKQQLAVSLDFLFRYVKIQYVFRHAVVTYKIYSTLKLHFLDELVR